MLRACGFRMILAGSSSPISWRRTTLASLIGSWRPCTTTASHPGRRDPLIALTTARLTRTCLLRTHSLLSGALANSAVTPPQSPSAPLIILVRCCVQSRRFGNGSMKFRAQSLLEIENPVQAALSVWGHTRSKPITARVTFGAPFWPIVSAAGLRESDFLFLPITAHSGRRPSLNWVFARARLRAGRQGRADTPAGESKLPRLAASSSPIP